MQAAFNLRAFESPAPSQSREEIAELYKAKKRELATLEAEVELLREELIEDTFEEWKEANAKSAEPVHSIQAGKATVSRNLRKKFVSKVPRGAIKCFRPTFKVEIDGDVVPKAKRQAVLNRIAKLEGLPKDAVKVSAGYVAKKDALPIAQASGDSRIVEFVVENAGYITQVRTRR